MENITLDPIVYSPTNIKKLEVVLWKKLHPRSWKHRGNFVAIVVVILSQASYLKRSMKENTNLSWGMSTSLTHS